MLFVVKCWPVRLRTEGGLRAPANSVDSPAVSGAHEGQCDRIRRCRSLLQGVQRNHLGGERGERSPFDAASSADHSPKHNGNQTAERDTQRERKHFASDADRSGRRHCRLGNQGGKSGNVSAGTGVSFECPGGGLGGPRGFSKPRARLHR